MPLITFLRPSGTRKFCKRFLKDKTEPYPPISAVSSHTVDHPLTETGLHQRIAAYRNASEAGESILKGNLTKELRNESRAGHTKKDELTHSVWLDIDGITVPNSIDLENCDSDVVAEACEYALTLLPACFQNVSYIGHASSSFGVKKGEVSLHLEFLLATPIAPRALKNVLFGLNFLNEELADQLTLTATGTALHYIVDPCLADNARMITIAAPEFVDTKNPFIADRDRFTLVKKIHPLLDLSSVLTACSPEYIANQQKKIIKHLRSVAGLPAKKERTVPLGFQGNQIRVCANPDQAIMEYAWHSDEFVYYNIHRGAHRGDSSAYYVRLDNPEIVFNFKNEPFFRFKDVDEDAYNEHLERFVNTSDLSETRFQPMVFRDFKTDLQYNALIDRQKNVIHEYAVTARRQSLEEFMLQHGEIMPDLLETMDFEFRPDDPRTLDLNATPRPFINRFAKSEYMRAHEGVSKTIRYDDILDAFEKCPAILLILMSAMGNDRDCVRHFIHWFAYIFQTRKRADTAWIFQGTFGTGKGAIGNLIVQPLLGPRYVTCIRNDELDEKFNAWAQESLMVVVDEFEIGDSKNDKALMARLKNLITEDEVAIRAMRTDTKKSKNYCNFIFNSNGYEVITLYEKDRRWNVCPRQETPLEVTWPNVKNEVRDAVAGELDQFAQLLSQVRVEEHRAKSVIENAARQDLIALSETTIDAFCHALKFGDMDYFAEVLGRPNSLHNDMLIPAKLVIKRIIRECGHGDPIRLDMNEICALYNAALEANQTNAKIGKTLSARGIATTKMKIDRRVVRALQITVGYDQIARKELLEEYFSVEDLLKMDDPALADMIQLKRTREQMPVQTYKH